MLSDADRAFFDQNGYLVVRQLIPREQVDAVVDAIWDFLEFDRDDPSDWYREPHRVNGMVEMYHHQALWDVRQHPAIYELFRDLFGQDDLWVFIDRANLKPPPNPEHPEFDHHGMIHWDIDVRETPTPFLVQGVLYLVDTRQGEGGFQCVPGVHRRAAEISAGISDEELRQQQLHEYFSSQIGPPIEVEADAGDFIIWHSALPHGNSRNESTSRASRNTSGCSLPIPPTRNCARPESTPGERAPIRHSRTHEHSPAIQEARKQNQGRPSSRPWAGNCSASMTGTSPSNPRPADASVGRPSCQSPAAPRRQALRIPAIPQGSPS